MRHFFLFLLFALNSSAAVYYVRTDGSDSNNGLADTSGGAWLTIQHAASTAVAGDTVHVGVGYYPERVTVANSGSIGSPITFDGGSVATNKGFQLVDKNYVTIQNFDIINTNCSGPNGVTDCGLYFRGGFDQAISNTIHDCTCRGVYIPANRSSPTAWSCTLQGNVMARCGWNGAEVKGSNHVVIFNEVYGSQQITPYAIAQGCSTLGDADGFRFHGANHLFVSNYIHDIYPGGATNPTPPHIDGFQTYQDASDDIGSNCWFSANQIVLTTDATGIGAGFMMEQDAGQQGPTNIFIVNNVVGQKVGVIIHGGAGIHIWNNTFYGQLTYSGNPAGVSCTYGVTNSDIQNNIFYDMAAHSVILDEANGPIVNVTTGNNLEYRHDGSTNVINNSYYDATRRAADYWNSNVTFSAGFQLAAGTWAIDHGTNLSGLVTNDFNGVSRPRGGYWDIGAYEYVPPSFSAGTVRAGRIVRAP